MAKNIYFVYEPNTGHYLRAVFADTKPANSTELEPTGLVNAVFNTDTNKWEGTSIADEMAKLAKSAKMSIDPDKQMLSSMMATMMKQEMRIQQLEAEQSGGAK